MPISPHPIAGATPVLPCALLMVAMTLDYIAADRWLARRVNPTA